MRLELKPTDYDYDFDQNVIDMRETGKGISHLNDDPDVVANNVLFLQKCKDYWDSLLSFRERRERARKYYRGDQWYESITDPDTPGQSITEEEYIKNQGKQPFKQNVIRPLIKNLLGQFRSSPVKGHVTARKRDEQGEAEMLTNALHAVQDINLTKDIDTRAYEEFLLSGVVCQKTTYQWWKNRNQEDVYIKNVNPTRLFFNNDISDSRMFNLRIIGELHDLSTTELISMFARTKEEEETIRQWYREQDYQTVTNDAFTPDLIENMDFYIAQGTIKNRVIEVWYLQAEWKTRVKDLADGSIQVTDYTIEEIDELNDQRIAQGLIYGKSPEQVPLLFAEEIVEETWHVKYLTPFGQELFHAETPYHHEEHPYSLWAYPMVDGEAWGLVEDIIDQQRYINRLISLLDFIMGSSAKGVLLVPEDCIHPDFDIDQIADEWSKFNGVIKLQTKQGQELPQQISANSINIGASELLSLQMQLLQDISGVTPAIRGEEAKSGTPSSLYAQQTANASMNVKDYIESFSNFKKILDTKTVKNIIQFYDEPRHLMISGNNYDPESTLYNPDKAKRTDWEYNITQGIDTPVYRQLLDDTLMKLFEAQAIDVKMFLSNSSLPFADKILKSIETKEQEMVEQGMANPSEAVLGGMAQQKPGNVSPQVQQMMKQMMPQPPRS